MVVRALILSLGLALAICSIGPFYQGLLVYAHGSSAARIAIFLALGLMLVGVSLIFLFRHLESRRPMVTLP